MSLPILTKSSGSNLGIKGDYKLVKVTVNGTDEDISGYSIRLNKADGPEEKIEFGIRVGNILNGLIVKNGKDAEGDLHQSKDVSTTAMGVFGKTGEDEDTISGAIYQLNRIKFSDDFNELTITAPNTVMQFKRFLPERMPHETDSLLS